MLQTATPEKVYETTQEKVVVTKNIALKGTDVLVADEVSTTYEVVRILSPTTGEPIFVKSRRVVSEEVHHMIFVLIEVTKKEIEDMRKTKTPSLVLKENDKLYYTEITKDLNFVSSDFIKSNKCSAANNECEHLSAASDEEGGCAKVRNKATYIERYPWITRGYETFNTNSDSFVVGECEHYEKCRPRKAISQ